MADYLKNPWAFAVVSSVLIAAVSWVYERTVTKDPAQLKKTFFKSLLASIVVLFVLTYWISRPEPTLTEPFHG